MIEHTTAEHRIKTRKQWPETRWPVKIIIVPADIRSRQRTSAIDWSLLVLYAAIVAAAVSSAIEVVLTWLRG